MINALNGESAAWLVVVELVILCSAGYTFFRRRGNTLAEACAYGLVTPLMTLSLLLQLSFMAGRPNLALVFEITLAAAALGYVFKHRDKLLQAWSSVRILYTRAPITSFLIGLLLAYLALLSLVIPPTVNDWQLLAQLLMVSGHHGALSSDSASAILAHSPQAVPSLNILILPHLFLRYQTDWGVGILGFMAYLSIGFSTYALSRRYAWPPTAATASIIVLSLPRLVYLSTSPGHEIIPTATALFCLLALFRAVESPNLTDMYLLALGLLFMITGNTINLVIPIVFVPLACILLFRRHGAATWWKLILTRPYLMLMFFFIAAVFSQLWRFIDGLFPPGSLLAEFVAAPIVFNNDGIQGALANALRYSLQIIHFTRPVDNLLNWATGFSFTGALQQINDNFLVPIFGNRGAAAAFHICWLPNEKVSWYGPFGFLLILPAVAYAVRRAPRRLKAVAVALIGYFFIVSLVPAWHSENVRYFDVFFVCGGIGIAYFLPPWRLTKNRRRLLAVISTSLMLYAGICNENKPAFGYLTNGANEGIWQASSWGRNRFWAAQHTFGDDRLVTTGKLTGTQHHLWLIYTDLFLLYPFLLSFPNARTLPAKAITPDAVNLLRSGDADFMLFIDCPPPAWLKNRNSHTLWAKPPGSGKHPGYLLQVE